MSHKLCHRCETGVKILGGGVKLFFKVSNWPQRCQVDLKGVKLTLRFELEI